MLYDHNVRSIILNQNLWNISFSYVLGWSQFGLMVFLTNDLIALAFLPGLSGSQLLWRWDLGRKKSIAFCFLMLLLLIGIFGKLDANFCIITLQSTLLRSFLPFLPQLLYFCMLMLLSLFPSRLSPRWRPWQLFGHPPHLFSSRLMWMPVGLHQRGKVL